MKKMMMPQARSRSCAAPAPPTCAALPAGLPPPAPAARPSRASLAPPGGGGIELNQGGGGASVPLPSKSPPVPPEVERVGSQGEAAVEAAGEGEAGTLDFTRIPAELDARLEALDTDAAMRPTKINVGGVWTKTEKRALLAAPSTATLRKAEQDREKRKAFDLLDALSRGGSLPIDYATLHVLVAATHCFDDSLISTLIVKNVNPIEKLERSSLIVAETICAQPARRLIKPEMYESVRLHAAPAMLEPLEG